MIQEILRSLLGLGYELLLVWQLWTYWQNWSGQGRSMHKVLGQGQPRQRHRQSPRDCPMCRRVHGRCEHHEARVVEPWTKQKSQRGRPKVVNTEGYDCPYAHCRYYQITDARRHAMVGDGLHYGADTIQYLRCQACRRKFSVRVGTPMDDLKTPAKRVDEVMTAPSEGVDVAAASRIFKHDERTIQHWLARTAAHAQRLHHHFFHNLVCAHLQLDELVARLRGLKEHGYVWVALDAHTKLIPVIHVGRRRHDDAMVFVHEL